MKFHVLRRIRELMRLAKLTERHVAFIEKTELIPHNQPPGLRHRQLFRHQHRACVVDHNIFFHVAQLAGIIVRAANVIAVPALRHGITGNTPVGEQRGLIKYFNVLEFLCSCVDFQNFMPPICGVYDSSRQLFLHPSKWLTSSVAVRATVGGSIVSEKQFSSSSNQQ